MLYSRYPVAGLDLPVANSRARPFEEAMRAYIKETLRINFESWDDDLAEKLRALEEGYRSSKKGFWHSFWLKMGDQRAAEVWTSFIPESHGLSVLKGGLSLIFLVRPPVATLLIILT